MKEIKEVEPVLHVFNDRSVLYNSKGEASEFKEGRLSTEAKERIEKLKDSLTKGYLKDKIEKAQDPQIELAEIEEDKLKAIQDLVDSVTSEVGRAIIGLSVLQLTIKSIIPEQSIRLHKGSNSATFSWVEGVPMRVIDKYHITPTLREYGLLRLNADGFMMTRSLAENYPYSNLYKAAIRGAKDEWTKITDWLENDELDAENGLMHLLVFLNNRSETFKKSVLRLEQVTEKYLTKNRTFEEILSLLEKFIHDSTYSARIFEIAIHALYQVFDEFHVVDGYLKPISQMRSANKKHGNIGDIEITGTDGGMDIIESWDAKYGKTYLRDELEELSDKLGAHPQCSICGFITDVTPNKKDEIIERSKEISVIHETEIVIVKFSEWALNQIKRYGLDKDTIGVNWMKAIVECISQKRREIAPIDEPTGEWVEYLEKVLS